MNDKRTAKRRVTLHDVAQAAGVSLKTTSNVINDSGRTTNETRAKVKLVIRDLDYRINVVTRNLNRDHTDFITPVVSPLTPPYLAEFANRIIEATRQRDYPVYATTYAEGPVKGMYDLLKKFNPTVPDGMILSTSEVENISSGDLKVDFPLIIVGARATQGIMDHVTPGDISVAVVVAGYLYGHGSTGLAVIDARDVHDEDALLNAMEGNTQLHLRGIIEETRRHGLSLDLQLIGDTDRDWTIGVGARVTQRSIDSGMPLDGVITLNDQLAVGASTALCTAGYEMSVQMRVVGLDNSEEAPYLQIPLTTMDSHLDWAAPTAVNCTPGRIDGGITRSELLITEPQVIARVSAHRAILL